MCLFPLFWFSIVYVFCHSCELPNTCPECFSSIRQHWVLYRQLKKLHWFTRGGTGVHFKVGIRYHRSWGPSTVPSCQHPAPDWSTPLPSAMLRGSPPSHRHQHPETQTPTRLRHLNFPELQLVTSFDTAMQNSLAIFLSFSGFQTCPLQSRILTWPLCTPKFCVFHKIKDQPYSRDAFCFYPYRENNWWQL